MNAKHLMLLLLTTVLLLYMPATTYAAVNASEMVIPFAPYRGVPASNILYPRLMTPVFIQPGDVLEIYTTTPEVTAFSLFNNLDAVVVHPTVVEGPIEIIEDRAESSLEKFYLYRVKTPDDMPTALYNLVAEIGGEEYQEINAVNVVPEFKETLKIAHFSDAHIGGYGGQYKYAYYYFDRMLYTVQALGADVMINTGDFLEQDKVRGRNHIYTMFDSMSIPVVGTMGNTDNVFNNNKVFLWEKYMGPDFGLAILGNVIVFALNFETGDISVDYVYQWMEEMLQAYPDKASIIIGHYPHWDLSVVSQKLVDNFKRLHERYGIDLALHGHIHTDVEKVSETTGIFSVSATSVAYGRQYNGFRFVYISQNGTVKADKADTVDIDKFYVHLSHFNNYTYYGMAIHIYNGLDVAKTVSIPVYLKDMGGHGHEVIQGNVEFEEKVEKTPAGFKEIITLRVEPGQNITILTFTKEDNEPPEILGDVNLVGFKEYLVIKYEAVDWGVGVAGAEAYYIVDGEEYKAEKVEMDSWLYLAVPRDLESFTLRLEVSDYLGNTMTMTIEYGDGGEDMDGEDMDAVDTGFMLDPMLLGVIVVALAVVVAILALRRRG